MAREVEGFVARQMALNGVRGLSMAVTDASGVIWSRGFGWADEAGRVPARPDTVYRAGSISKVVTSVRVMQLAEAGRVDLDTDVRRLVPDFSVRSRYGDASITPRMLMSHRSGLPTDVLAGMWTEHPQTLAQYIPTLARESLASPPVNQWRYSNVAFSVLGRMIENVEGADFAEAMRRGLLEPAGMASSSFVMTAGLYPRYAKGYANGAEAPRPTLRDQPAGSLFTTVEDLAAFAATVLGNGKGVVSEASLRQMATQQFPGLALDFGFRMGLGWMLSGMELSDGRELVWHGGAALPHQAFLALEPESGLAVAVCANTTEASRFIPQLTVKTLELAMEAATGRRMPAPPKAIAPRPVKLPRERLEALAGDYATFAAAPGTVRVEDGTLRARSGGTSVELVPSEGGVLAIKSDAFFGLVPTLRKGLFLEPVAAAGRSFLVLRGQSMPTPFEKLERAPVPRAWLARLGRYAAATPGEGVRYKTLELAVRGGVLVAEAGVTAGPEGSPVSQAVFALTVVSDDEAVIAGVGTNTGSVVRAEGLGLYHSGFDFRPLR